MNPPIFLKAVELALQGEWDAAHEIVQESNHKTANWIHAVVPKIEGDAWNSRYWYARTDGRHYEDFGDSSEELAEIKKVLSEG